MADATAQAYAFGKAAEEAEAAGRLEEASNYYFQATEQFLRAINFTTDATVQYSLRTQSALHSRRGKQLMKRLRQLASAAASRRTSPGAVSPAAPSTRARNGPGAGSPAAASTHVRTGSDLASPSLFIGQDPAGQSVPRDAPPPPAPVSIGDISGSADGAAAAPAMVPASMISSTSSSPMPLSSVTRSAAAPNNAAPQSALPAAVVTNASSTSTAAAVAAAAEGELSATAADDRIAASNSQASSEMSRAMAEAMAELHVSSPATSAASSSASSAAPPLAADLGTQSQLAAPPLGGAGYPSRRLLEPWDALLPALPASGDDVGEDVLSKAITEPLEKFWGSLKRVVDILPKEFHPSRVLGSRSSSTSSLRSSAGTEDARIKRLSDSAGEGSGLLSNRVLMDDYVRPSSPATVAAGGVGNGTGTGSPASSAAADTEIAQLRRDNTMLRARAAKAAALEEENARLRASITQFRAELMRHAHEFKDDLVTSRMSMSTLMMPTPSSSSSSSADPSAAASAAAAAAALSAEIASLRQALAQANGRIATMQHEGAQARAQASGSTTASEARITQLRRELAESQERVEALKRMRAEQDLRLDRYRKRWDALKSAAKRTRADPPVGGAVRAEPPVGGAVRAPMSS